MLDLMPVEVVDSVFQHLDAESLGNINLTNRRFRQINMPRFWANLEITLYSKDHKDGIGRKQWTPCTNSGLYMFDRKIYGVWIVIGVHEAREFMALVGDGKLATQLACVKTLNFDQQVMQQRDKRKSKRRRWSWLGLADDNEDGPQNPYFADFKRVLTPGTLPKVDTVRLRGNELSSGKDRRASTDILDNFQHANTGLATNATNVDAYNRVNMLHLTVASELPTTPMRWLGLLELYSVTAQVFDAKTMRAFLAGTSRLKVLTIVNISLNNPDSVEWLPGTVQVLNITVGASNYLDGRLGKVLECPGVDVFTVRDAHGFVKKIMPTSLTKLEFNYKSPKCHSRGGYEVDLLLNNPKLQSLVFYTPTQVALHALTHHKCLTALELGFTEMSDDMVTTLMQLKHLPLQRLTLIFDKVSAAQTDIVWHFTHVENLHVIHFDKTSTVQFAQKFGHLCQYKAYSGMVDFVMDVRKMRRV